MAGITSSFVGARVFTNIHRKTQLSLPQHDSYLNSPDVHSPEAAEPVARVADLTQPTLPPCRNHREAMYAVSSNPYNESE